MKIIRFFYQDKIMYGVLENDIVHEIINFKFSKNFKVINNKYKLNQIQILAPVKPNKVIGLAYNYKDLVGDRKSYDDPLVFMKSPTSVVGINDEIKIPINTKVWVEVELVLVVGEEVRSQNSSRTEKIFGYTIGNDITAESKYGRDHHLAQSKARDKFAPIGPFIETKLDTKNLELKNKIDGKIFQHGNTSKRIFDDYQCIELVQSIMSLDPGDIIFTGTPANAENSIVKSGSICELSIEGLGKLINKII